MRTVIQRLYHDQCEMTRGAALIWSEDKLAQKGGHAAQGQQQGQENQQPGASRPGTSCPACCPVLLYQLRTLEARATMAAVQFYPRISPRTLGAHGLDQVRTFRQTRASGRTALYLGNRKSGQKDTATVQIWRSCFVTGQDGGTCSTLVKVVRLYATSGIPGLPGPTGLARWCSA